MGRVLKKPEEILALKVCDPAMGSGSFLVSAVRFLTEALRESLYFHGRLQTKPDRTVVVRLADGLPADHPSNDTLPVPEDHPEFEDRLRGRLKRYVVERCLYGVDLDPLAVELGRTALWVETMDYRLPFGFLDHKLKCGNALVGCWFDRFQDYPVMAWEREGGDKAHDRFVHHFREVPAKKAGGPVKRAGDKWTAAIKQRYAEVIKPELKSWLSELDPKQGRLEVLVEGRTADELHEDALRIFEELHALPVHEVDARIALYREKILDSKPLQKLKTAFDTWCALWFWPGDELELAPTPRTFLMPDEAVRARVERLAEQHHFFHWELEFPDVFTGPEAGFHAIVGNPPWEIQKPNSMEFFSNIDPLYRTYGKQEALQRQQELFESNAVMEGNWLAYNARFKALSNWTKNVARPFGGGNGEGEALSLARGQEGQELLERWRNHRAGRRTYADGAHPFQHQGSADINSYKMFLEVAHAVLAQGGVFGLLCPSGLYSDKGSQELRALFLNRCAWTHLYAFQNERFVFEHIHHSFKMAVTHVRKGSRTEAILTRFRLGPGDSPEAHEVEEDLLDSSKYLALPADRIHQFSPESGALLEVRTARDLRVIQKLYERGVLIDDGAPDGWSISYVREFDMTSDSELFPPRLKWEEKGFRTDEYGRWKNQSGELALPMYEGRLFGAYDFAAKAWVSGTGLRAIWREVPWGRKVVEPQYLIGVTDALNSKKFVAGPKVSYRNIARNTDTRSFIATVLARDPTPHVTSNLVVARTVDAWALCAVLNSLTFDWLARGRLAGTHFDYHVIAEFALPRRELAHPCVPWVVQLANGHAKYAPEWTFNREMFRKKDGTEHPWKRLWAITAYERLRLRCMLDAVVAELYGLDIDDFAWILRDCDHPVEQVCDKPFSRTLDPKGFWRVDKENAPELRHTVLSLVAFHELKRMGLDAFLALNDGDGWMLPETLRLADYGLGHDERAKQPQPVASALGERFLPWQLEQGVEESWEECRRHAELISRIVPPPESPQRPEPTAEPPAPNPPPASETDLFGKPQQRELFGSDVEKPGKRRRRN